MSTGFIDHHVAYSLGVTRAQLGDRPDAMKWLRRATDTGFPCYPFFVSDPLLAPMRNDAAFNTLLAELKRKHDGWTRKYR